MDDTLKPRAPVAALAGLRWANRFARLDPAFFTRLDPTPLRDPYLVAADESAAALIGLSPEALAHPDFARFVCGNLLAPGCEPLASVYSGHQFGAWAGQLGDGRAILLGDAVGPDGRPWELQLKGSGLTPYSRMGDGRAVLRSSIREFLCSEAMHALGIPSTRALAVAGSDEAVFRETMETSAVVARMSPSFLRFGHFEHFYYAGQHARLESLADHLIDWHFPELRDAKDRYAGLLELVCARTAELIAQWQCVGFCHGVMNTDNMSMLGLTIDYGPFGFIDGFDANHVCNHSDTGGRYAYSMQPGVAEWNLYCLAQAMMPLLDSQDQAQAILAGYRPGFSRALGAGLRGKLGLRDERPDDEALFDSLFSILHRGRVDFTRFFRFLSRVRSADAGGDSGCRDLFADRAQFDSWVAGYRERLQSEGADDADRAARMNAVNPKFVLRNYLAETAIRAARGDDESQRLRAAPGAGRVREAGEFEEVRRLAAVLSRPYDEQPEHESYAAAPPDWACALEVSCSS
ncbi:MAG: YdiU family protein [Burkholderiaceae bacterium]|nr:YdiU family protein [Burkholderiaceae bacterium]